MRTLIDSVRAHARSRPDARAVRMYTRRNPRSATWAELEAALDRAAGALAARGVTQGDVVVLIGTFHLDLYAVWLGAVKLGAVPSVLADPSVRQAPEVYWQRLAALIERTRPRLVACDPKYLAKLSAAPAADVEVVGFDAIARGVDGASAEPARLAPDDLLLLQHSSGTTGLQKGVMLTHGAVAAHAEAYGRTIGLTSRDVIASWLPLYHDMGLIAAFIGPLWVGAEVVWMSPFEWVASPTLMLEAITATRATVAWLPNFAFAFMAARAPADLAPDLSSVRALINCSEPVTAQAFDAFLARFGAHGLAPGALQSCFAMAENVFAMTSTAPGAPPLRWRVDRERWQREHRAEDPAPGAASVELVSSGRPIEGVSLRVVDEAGADAPDGVAGRVWIKSPFLFAGYHRAGGAAPFDAAGYFDTGDLGVRHPSGEVFITGRAKDLVIVGGKNVYPQDVEDVVGAVEGAHPGRVVCFGARVRAHQTEGLVVLLEPDVEEPEWPALTERVRAAVPAQLDLDVLDVRVVARGSLRKSSSGKLARAGNREWYFEGRFGAPPSELENT